MTTPEYIRKLRESAEYVRKSIDDAIALPTDQRKQEAEFAQKGFKEKYPHYRWQDWCKQRKENENTVRER